ncbi:FAD-binding domain-containing protein [Patellaria atrata CBS 101060]|uniref:FAD-binding domain-containing protein n=1 Tax=Patellaria atrata CBS 101060 TaxID=1346257 RepID=A0A9P4S7D8_9PEZI|nr:FAD-binding domain-containing protein [Patellaria atrata CBS 101060]
MKKISLALGILIGYLPFSAADCNQLHALLPGKVFFEPSEIYNASISSYFPLQGRLSPTCILRPESAKDVSLAVKTLARKRSTHFAIRSGGHSPNHGFSNIDDGVTIDLRSMNDIALSKDWKIARVQSGAVWGDVYPVTDQVGVSVIGGRGGTVGTGGFITGGGISAFSRRRGWGCDNVVNFQVVLASGEIVDANAAHNKDLFRALKGGQNNFGVVTRIDLMTHEQSPFLGGAILYPKEAFDATLDAFTEYMNRSTFDPDELAELSYTYVGGDQSFSLLLNTFHSGSVQSPNSLQRWTSIQPQISSTVRTTNMSKKLQPSSCKVYADLKRVMYGTTSVGISPTIMKKAYTLWEAAVNDTLSRISGMNSAFIIQPTPPPPKSFANSLGFGNAAVPEADSVIVLLAHNWDSEADSKVVEDRTYELIREINNAAADEHVEERFRYLNYAASKQKIFDGYGQASKAFLRKVARKYDPDGVFQRQVKGGFKVF